MPSNAPLAPDEVRQFLQLARQHGRLAGQGGRRAAGGGAGTAVRVGESGCDEASEDVGERGGGAIVMKLFECRRLIASRARGEACACVRELLGAASSQM